ncbi:FAD-dependent oxidoreductase [bacterium]|nr:FAD-dependent oxidoreductase [candidate division CSSED10-310 bacterium]
MNNSKDIIIIGSGPAGLSVGNHLSNKDFLILESLAEPGGLMRSKYINGYTFDWAGHIFFTKIERVKKWVELLLGDNLHWQDRESWVFSKNVFTRYPFQANTFGLPKQVIKECLMGLIDVTFNRQSTQITNFEEWILKTYGQGIATHFMLPYNRKLWARDLKTMDHHWLEGRVPQPGLEDFVDGALGPGRKDMGPNSRFGYPLKGGMRSLVEKLVSPIRDHIITHSQCTRIHPEKHRIQLHNGQEYSYGSLVLTCPLTDILTMLDEYHTELKSVIPQLNFVSVLCVNVGIHKPDLTDKHWIYFPESEFLFHRVFVQANASPHVCPDNCFSYTAEITYNDQKKVDFQQAGKQTVEGLLKAGLLKSMDDVDVIDLINIPVAYIVPTHDRQILVSKIREWLSAHDIHLVGRFAEWAYYNMDHALDAGWTLVSKL